MNAIGQIQPGKSEERLCELARLFAVPARGPLEEQLENLKMRMLGKMLNTEADPGLARELAWAANEAAAVAWYTGYPTLLFPALFEEKAQSARKRWERQMELWQYLAA
jgi:hypothetical protein